MNVNQYEDIVDFFSKPENEKQEIISEVFGEYLSLCQLRKLNSQSIFEELDDLIHNMTMKENYESAFIFREIKKGIESSIEYTKKKR